MAGTLGSSEKERLRGFVLTIVEFIGLPVDEPALEPIRACNNLRGLRMAATDMIDSCQDLTSQQVKQLDQLLVTSGFPTLSEMRDRSLQRLRRILSNRRVATVDERRFLESYLSDVDSDVVTEEDRALANRILAEYDSGG
jgi:hypothetical protein